MKVQFLTIVALAALTACSSNANKNASTTQPEAESANPVENAIKLWSENESIKSFQEAMDTTYAPNQMAYYDIDGDGTAELFLREYVKEHEMTGFIAAYTLKNGVKEIALSNNSWETTWLCVYNNGVVRTDEGSEGGMDGTTTYFKLKNSELEKIYIQYTTEDEETGEVEETFQVATPNTNAGGITKDEFNAALGACVGENAYENELNINDFKWEDIK
ncbi:MAG: hypothetical protein J6W13_10505 [Salinivirgaceae bacterium]|nr:hypothetical protein [Salinivirgaceae bacterium]